MEIIKETKYLQFTVFSEKGKTKVVDIINTHHNKRIGVIKWYPQKKQYCFFSYA